MRLTKLTALLLVSSLLSGCSNTLDKIENIGKPPPFEPVVNPQEKPDYKPLSWPMPENLPPQKQYANSLWQPGARAFYRDQRAARVGDILRVNVSIKDKAEVDNETERKRDNTDSLGAPKVFGFENTLAGNIRSLPIPLKDPADPASLLSVNGSSNAKGTGKIKREEKIETQIAAMITQVLPNGNLVIEGNQEINVNFELRAVSIRGVIRPQDIRSDNTIDSTQVAEARINYGGRGHLTDVQQQRWGSQLIDAVTPF
jgi:flagellar L-ring protein precursor FlgH